MRLPAQAVAGVRWLLPDEPRKRLVEYRGKKVDAAVQCSTLPTLDKTWLFETDSAAPMLPTVVSKDLPADLSKAQSLEFLACAKVSKHEAWDVMVYRSH
jgi:hypothetical protein